MEELISKINNNKISNEFKLFILIYISGLLDNIRNSFNEYKTKILNLITDILREISYFYEILDAVYEKYILSVPSEKANKNDYLENNLFKMDGKTQQENFENYKKLNHTKLNEILLYSNYEKNINPDEVKVLPDMLKQTINLLKLINIILTLENNQNNQNNQQQNNNLNISNQQSISGMNCPYVHVSRRSMFLTKLFKSFFNLSERIFRNHTHIQESQENSAKPHQISLLLCYINLPPNLCYLVFQDLMPFFYESILENYTKCPNKNCALNIIVDTIFDSNYITGTQNNANNELLIRKELFDIFLEYFMTKIHYIGNPMKTYDKLYHHNSNSQTVLISIYKSLFKCLPIFGSDEKTKQKIANFLVSCLILTKNSKLFGNYVYIIRCLFKALLSITHSNNQSQPFEFYKETIHLVYGVMKLMINLKEDFPFLKEMLTEIIMIFPIKFKYMIEYSKIVFPSLIDALNMNQEIIPVGLQYLEQWMNALYHKPENVKPYLQNNINLLTTLLTSHLHKNYAISLNSLKLLSKLGGRSRNYLEDKNINPKTSPTNILVIDLKEFNGEKTIEFPLDNIVDLCIKIVTNYKRHLDKVWLTQIRTSFKTLKTCFLTFFNGGIDIEFIKKKVEIIKNNIKNNNNIFTRKKSVYVTFDSNYDQIKINLIYKKAEHFIIEKLLRGVFLCCTIVELEGILIFLNLLR